MKPINIGGHTAYQDFVLAQLRKYYPDADTSLDSATWEVMDQFWNLDLSAVDQIMQDRYSLFGPQPRLPSDMLRSYLLSMKFKVPSLTFWAFSLKQNYLYAILSRFAVGDTPGVGTFCDFTRRLWLSERNTLSDLLHPPKDKPKKPKKKGEKATQVEKVMVHDLLEKFEIEPPQDFAPAKRLFDIFKSQFLDKSFHEGLIDLGDFAVSGDGTPVYREHGNRSPAPVIVWKKRSVTVNTTASTISWIVTSVGIPTGTITISDTISICSRLLTLKATFPFFLSWGRLPGMTHMDSCITTSPCCSSFRKPMSASPCSIQPMAPWLTMNTVVTMTSSHSLN